MFNRKPPFFVPPFCPGLRRYHVPLALVPAVPHLLSGVVYMVGMVRKGPPPRLPMCVSDVNGLQLLPLLGFLLLPASLITGGVAS